MQTWKSKTKATFFLSSTETGKRSSFFSATQHAPKLHSELQEQEWLLAELSVSTKEVYHVFIVLSIWAHHELHPKLRKKPIKRRLPKDYLWHSHRPLADAIPCVMVPVWCCCHTKGSPGILLLLLLVFWRLLWSQSWLGNVSFWNTEWSHAS